MDEILKYYDELKTSTSAQLVARGWTEISLADYYYFLECVPPLTMKDNAFVVGECITHGLTGAIYDTCLQVSERYFMRPTPIKEFSPAKYTAEIQKQFSL
jgi:hypothetical protein